MPPMQRLRQLAINADGFAFDPATGESFTLNAPGMLILEGLRAGHAPEAIVAQVTDRYEVEPAEAARDVADFLDALRTFRLL
jgi:PqqD family protein of HPr-rel-A system